MLKILKPEIFQGIGKTNNYFEGWYYKLVSKDENSIFAIIPGISYPKENENAHSFIQVFDGINNKYTYHKYDTEQFKYSYSEFEVIVGKSYFSSEKIVLNIDDELAQITASLEFSEIHPWPVSILSPGAMGFFAYIPFMEDYHGILSLNNVVNGYITYNGNYNDFDEGKGFIEKDWGTSFPESWIWIQSNHFDEYDACFTISIAKIPWLGKSFTGFICGFWFKKKLYKFCTYTGAKITKLDIIDNSTLLIELRNNKYVIQVRAQQSGGFDLNMPVEGNVLAAKVNESLTSNIEINFFEKKSQKIIYQGSGRNAGIEIKGNIEQMSEDLT